MDQMIESIEDLPQEIADMLPQEMQDVLQQEKAARLEKLEAIGQAVAKKRDDAVNGRASSGIEPEWGEDEEAYLGIDDANRGKDSSYKPLSPNGGAIIPRKDASVRSTVFLNITRPYVDAASARVADMMLPTDDRNWSIKPTPIPEIEGFIKQSAGAMTPAPVPPAGGAAPPGMPGSPVQQDPMAQAVSQAMEIMAEARKKAEAAETQIEDWLVECNWHAEVRKVIEDCARIGSGIMKGPTPIKRKKMRAAQSPEGMAMQMVMEIDPASKRIDPWKFYPDPNCGESIHNGQYVFEMDEITSRQLKDLKGTPGYLSEMIDKVLEEGPGKKNLNSGSMARDKRTGDDDLYQIWYGYMILEKDDLEMMGQEIEADSMPAIVTLVNDTAIKASLNPLDSGEFPYDLMPWQRRQGMPWGVGVSRQIRTPQRMLNAGARNMMDNAGLSGGPQIVIRKNMITPVDGSWTLTPRKFWYLKEDADVRSAQDAIFAINIPNMQAELMNIIQFAMKMAEDVTGLPQIMQGQLGQAPDTVGGMQMLANNASTVLRRIARTFDDYITEPHIRRYYQFLMMYGDDNLKGDYCIDARGSTALVERDLQNQAIMQMGNMVLNPAFGLSPSKWIKEAIKAQRLDPKKFEMDEEEKAALQNQQPPEAPQVVAAKIRSETELKKEDIRAKVDIEEARMEQDRDAIYVQAETQRTELEHRARMEELAVKRELEMLRYATQNKVTLDKVKADLAKESMRLSTQKELAAATNAIKAPQVARPAIEPPGRAPAGQAFQH